MMFHDSEFFDAVVTILLLLTICSSKHTVSFRTAPDCDIAMSTLYWWVQTLKMLCVDLFYLTEADLLFSKCNVFS